MRWIGLVESPEHVCCRYRLTAFQSAWQAAGIELELQALPRGWLARIPFYTQLRGQRVILQRRLLPVWEIALLRRQAARLLFDFDDAVFLRDSYASRGLHDARRLRRFAAMLHAADAIVAGNDYLADAATRQVAPTKVHAIPTCVEPARYTPPRPGKPAGPLEMVWIGSSSTLQGLERVSALLEAIGQSVPDVRLKVICDRFPTLRHLPVTCCAWSEASEAAELAAADVGISWLPDDAWSRGKCGLKLLQYMAAGLPVVANPVGVQRQLVQHGVNGLLAETAAEWCAALHRLAADPQLRQRMGRAGRAQVEASYSVQRGAEAWLQLFEQLDMAQLRAA